MSKEMELNGHRRSATVPEETRWIDFGRYNMVRSIHYDGDDLVVRLSRKINPEHDVEYVFHCGGIVWLAGGTDELTTGNEPFVDITATLRLYTRPGRHEHWIMRVIGRGIS